MPTPASYQTRRNLIRSMPPRVWVGLPPLTAQTLHQIIAAHARTLPDTTPTDYSAMIDMAVMRIGIPKQDLAHLLHLEPQTLYNAGVSRTLSAPALERLRNMLSIRGWRRITAYVMRLQAAAGLGRRQVE